jgi:putative flippase GtrA
MVAEAKVQRARLAPLLWYAVIATFNAVFYVALSMGLVALGLASPLAGMLALAPVLAVSYLGHKAKTFRSAGSHRREAPRFLALGVLDFSLAGIVPKLALLAHWPPLIAFMALTTLIPCANFLLMRLWVFKAETGA